MVFKHKPPYLIKKYGGFLFFKLNKEIFLLHGKF